MQLEFIVKGLDRLIAKATPDILREPLREFWVKAGETVRDQAIERAPEDTGRLARSIGFAIDAEPMPLFVKIGPNVGWGVTLGAGSAIGADYVPMVIAIAQEFGTGLLNEGGGALNEAGYRSRHHPPGHGPQGWALRHGFKSGYQVANIIAKRGGLRPRRYMRDGYQASLGRINQLVKELGKAIRDAWGSGV